jgi:DNA-directed RNA polymerase specialized sigma subunit|nr:MAG TPA: ECF sigma factor [Caudoviricetes sp.]
MNKEQREVRKRLKGINTVKQFEEMLDSVLISEEERRILNLIYKEQKPFSIVADEIGISERTLTRKHAKLLMKIGSMF